MPYVLILSPLPCLGVLSDRDLDHKYFHLIEKDKIGGTIIGPAVHMTASILLSISARRKAKLPSSTGPKPLARKAIPSSSQRIKGTPGDRVRVGPSGQYPAPRMASSGTRTPSSATSSHLPMARKPLMWI